MRNVYNIVHNGIYDCLLHSHLEMETVHPAVWVAVGCPALCQLQQQMWPWMK